MLKYLNLSSLILLPVIVAIGAYFVTWITPILLIAAVILYSTLFALGKIKGNIVYLVIFSLSLGLIWQTTMLGVDVVGSDIHTEFYFAQRSLNQGWDITYPEASNSSIVIGVLIPLLAKSIGIGVLWVMKLILPVFLALVPVVLFDSFKRLFGEQKAYYSALFFMIVPVFSLEIAQIAKSMVAELFFATMLWGLICNLKWYWKLPIIGGSLVLQILCHYTVGIMGICFLLCVLGFKFISLPIKRWQQGNTNILIVLVCLLIGCATFYGYHSYAANGGAWRSIRDIGLQYLPASIQKLSPNSDNVIRKTEIVKGSNDDIPIVEVPVSKIDAAKVLDTNFESRPTLVRLGVGADFLETSWDGKIFRIIQYLTQFLILLGGVWLLWKYKVPNEYLGLVGGSIVLLMMCVFISGVSQIINMSRFYHMSLFFIAPLFVLGCEFINKWKIR